MIKAYMKLVRSKWLAGTYGARSGTQLDVRPGRSRVPGTGCQEMTGVWEGGCYCADSPVKGRGDVE